MLSRMIAAYGWNNAHGAQFVCVYRLASAYSAGLVRDKVQQPRKAVLSPHTALEILLPRGIMSGSMSDMVMSTMASSTGMGSMSMDMGSSMSMDMASATMSGMSMMASATSAAAAAASSSASSMDMSGMDMGGSSSTAACQISMTWNWYTIDACFLSQQWHVTSSGMFAGSCIGVIFLVIALEFVRRAHREYDRFIVRQWRERISNRAASPSDEAEKERANKVFVMGMSHGDTPMFYPNIFQQAIRACFYAVEVGAAYITMLLIMSYNGYMFFCILIGYLIGYFLFSADSIHDEEIRSQCC